MLIAGSGRESGAWNNSSTQRIACSLGSWSASCRGKCLLWGNMELGMALKAGTSLSALRPQVCSCRGDTAVRTGRFGVKLHLFPQFPRHVLGAMFWSMLWASLICKVNQNWGGRYHSVTWILLWKLSTRIGHKNISLGLGSAEVMAGDACVTPWPSQERFYLQKCRYWYSE